MGIHVFIDKYLSVFLVESCKRGSLAEWELKAEGIISMYHGQLLPFIIIHQKVWGCMKKNNMVEKKKAFKWDRTHGLRFIYQYFAKFYRKQCS